MSLVGCRGQGFSLETFQKRKACSTSRQRVFCTASVWNKRRSGEPRGALYSSGPCGKLAVGQAASQSLRESLNWEPWGPPCGKGTKEAAGAGWCEWSFLGFLPSQLVLLLRPSSSRCLQGSICVLHSCVRVRPPSCMIAVMWDGGHQNCRLPSPSIVLCLARCKEQFDMKIRTLPKPCVTDRMLYTP